jgi:hypothetical protein
MTECIVIWIVYELVLITHASTLPFEYEAGICLRGRRIADYRRKWSTYTEGSDIKQYDSAKGWDSVFGMATC